MTLSDIRMQLQELYDGADISESVISQITDVQYTLVGGMQPNDLNNLNDMYKQSGGLSEAIKTYIAKASQGKFWFKISKQEQLPIQVLQIDDEVQIVGNT
ncbi:Mobile element protein [Spiroplasma endosymbiont of Danaus chrysippus]|nr:Mobile element protein [Spiroplasma endosymbiont of Danaus chrysippus]